MPVPVLVQRQAREQEVAQRAQVGAVELAGGGVGEHRLPVGGQRPVGPVAVGAQSVKERADPAVRLAREVLGDLRGQHAGQRQLQRRGLRRVADHRDRTDHAFRVGDRRGRLGQAGERRGVVLWPGQGHGFPGRERDGGRGRAHRGLAEAVAGYETQAVEQPGQLRVGVGPGAHEAVGVEQHEAAARARGGERVEHLLAGIRPDVDAAERRDRGVGVEPAAATPRPRRHHRRAHHLRGTRLRPLPGEERAPRRLQPDRRGHAATVERPRRCDCLTVSRRLTSPSGPPRRVRPG